MSFYYCPAPAFSALYPLSLHDALPIYRGLGVEFQRLEACVQWLAGRPAQARRAAGQLERSQRTVRLARAQPRRELRLGNDLDRKSTRLNSSHLVISYAVFCLKKKNYNK